VGVHSNCPTTFACYTVIKVMHKQKQKHRPRLNHALCIPTAYPAQRTAELAGSSLLLRVCQKYGHKLYTLRPQSQPMYLLLCVFQAYGNRQYTSIHWSHPLYVRAICIKAASLQITVTRMTSTPTMVEAAYCDVLARLQVIANVFADSLPELFCPHFFQQPHEPGLLPV